MTRNDVGLFLVLCCAVGRTHADSGCLTGDIASASNAKAEAASPAVPRATPVANGVLATADRLDQARIRALESSLWCLVCNNETIADSTADLAIDLRKKVRDQVAEGMTDGQIRDYIITRYVDFILYDPPFRQIMWLLWIGPFVLIVMELATLVRSVRQRQRAKRSFDDGDSS